MSTGSSNPKGVSTVSTGEAVIDERPADAHHRIVVGVDGSEGAAKALRWAASQAKQTGALLEIHAASGWIFTTPAEAKESMQAVIDRASADALSVAPGISVKTFTHEGSPAKALIEASDGAELLVVGTRGLGGFRGLLLGSTSQEVSLHSSCSVVVVR